MAWLAVNKDCSEYIFAEKPYREISSHFGSYWETGWFSHCIELPQGSIKKLIGRELTWDDEPVELKEEDV